MALREGVDVGPTATVSVSAARTRDGENPPALVLLDGVIASSVPIAPLVLLGPVGVDVKPLIRTLDDKFSFRAKFGLVTTFSTSISRQCR